MRSDAAQLAILGRLRPWWVSVADLQRQLSLQLSPADLRFGLEGLIASRVLQRERRADGERVRPLLAHQFGALIAMRQRAADSGEGLDVGEIDWLGDPPYFPITLRDYTVQRRAIGPDRKPIVLGSRTPAPIDRDKPRELYSIGHHVARHLREHTSKPADREAIERLEEFHGTADDVRRAARIFLTHGEPENAAELMALIGGMERGFLEELPPSPPPSPASGAVPRLRRGDRIHYEGTPSEVRNFRQGVLRMAAAELRGALDPTQPSDGSLIVLHPDRVRDYAHTFPELRIEVVESPLGSELPPSLPRSRPTDAPVGTSSSPAPAPAWPGSRPEGWDDMTAPQRRRALRAHAKERQREILPRLKQAIRDTKKARAKALRACAGKCKQRKDRISRAAEGARLKLRERIAALKAKARETCGACRVNAKAAELDKIDHLLGELQAEREQIAQLRRIAATSKSGKGAAGGKRAAELRAESDDEVARNLNDDPLLLAVWGAVKRKIKATPNATRTEAFLQWVHDNTGAVAEIQAQLERRYDEEAAAMFERLRTSKGKSESDLEAWHGALDEAERLLEDVPF